MELNDVVRSALELAAYAIRTAGIEVVADLAPDLPPLHADPDQLNQVVMNLIVNAQHALQERAAPRRLTLRTSSADRGRTVRLQVADNGPGVPPESRRRIFEPFYTSKPQGLGTGIGLTFSLGVVEAHGGKLRLEDPTEGGACFTVELPAIVAAGAADRASAGLEAPVAVAPVGTALVIDDEADLGDASGAHRLHRGAADRLR